MQEVAEHTATLLSKQGHEWTNDDGQTFPAIPLYRVECSCGWKGAAWYGDPARAMGFYSRHVGVS